jgi:hypothetical protein
MMEEMVVLDWAVASPSRLNANMKYMVMMVQDFDSDLTDQRAAKDLLKYLAALLTCSLRE